jgi:hypothetical protein
LCAVLKTVSVGSTGQEMYLGHYYQYCPDTPVGLYACGHAETVIALNKVGQPAKERCVADAQCTRAHSMTTFRVAAPSPNRSSGRPNSRPTLDIPGPRNQRAPTPDVPALQLCTNWRAEWQPPPTRQQCKRACISPSPNHNASDHPCRSTFHHSL